jgi:hypothetical protein
MGAAWYQNEMSDLAYLTDDKKVAEVSTLPVKVVATTAACAHHGSPKKL